MSGRLDVIDLGRRGYQETLDLQRQLRLARIEFEYPNDLLLLVEHDPVYTLGRSTRASSLPLPTEALQAAGAEVVEVERGGDVTWHGPGQLVGYPILDLTALQEDLHWYLRTLEEALIGALATLGVPGRCVAGRTGVWTGSRKIASIGVHVKQWVTLHGFALNVQPDLAWFDAIVPCGIVGVEMTSVRRELGTSIATAALWEESCDAVIAAMGAAFSREPVPASRDALLALPPA